MEEWNPGSLNSEHSALSPNVSNNTVCCSVASGHCSLGSSHLTKETFLLSAATLTH